MRVVSGPRWWGLLILMSLVASGIILVAWLTSPADALLHALSDRLPATTAGTVAAPLLSGVLGVGGGLLAARRNGWIDYRLRSLVIIGCVVCTLWLVPVGAFWLVVQGELMALLDGAAGSSAGLSALCTLLLPATGTVLAGAGLVAVQVRSTIRLVALEGHVQTARSQGLPTTGPVVRRVLRHTLPAVVAVQLVEFLVLYGGSLTVQAAFAAPPLAADLQPLLPAESLPLVLGAILLGVVGLVTAGFALAASTPAAVVEALQRTSAEDGGLAALFTSSRLPPARFLPAPADTAVLASTGFRAADFLDIRDLRTLTTGQRVQREPLAGISLTVARGQTLAVIGDDRDGTSLLCHAIAGMQQLRHSVMSGSILFDGIELVGLPERDFRHLRGQRIGFLPAPAADRLDPNSRVGQHLVTLLTRQTETTRSLARTAALELLVRVGLEDAERVFAAYPGELPPVTGQRVLLAGALVGAPQLMVADDPTRGFAPAETAAFLDLLHSVQHERGFTLITASLKVETAVRCDRVAIMSGGAIVEYASVPELLSAPQHPHTQRLLARGGPGSTGP